MNCEMLMATHKTGVVINIIRPMRITSMPLSAATPVMTCAGGMEDVLIGGCGVDNRSGMRGAGGLTTIKTRPASISKLLVNTPIRRV